MIAMIQHGVLISLSIALLWSLAPIFHKYIYKSGIDPKTMMIISGISYASMLIAYIFVHKSTFISDIPRLTVSTVAVIFVSVLLTSFTANLLYYYAIKHHEAFLVTGLAYTAPLFTMVFAWLLLKEKISMRAAMGVLLIVVGAYLVIHK